MTEQKVTLSVEDDDIFEEDEHFYIRISNPRRKDGIEIPQMNVEGEGMVPSIQLGTPHMATIMILDDDHGDIFQVGKTIQLHVWFVCVFSLRKETKIVESIGTYELLAFNVSLGPVARWLCHAWLKAPDV